MVMSSLVISVQARVWKEKIKAKDRWGEDYLAMCKQWVKGSQAGPALSQVDLVPKGTPCYGNLL